MWPVIAILCFKVLGKRLKEKLEDIREWEKGEERRMIGEGRKKKKKKKEINEQWNIGKEAEQEGKKTKGSLSEPNSSIPFAVTASTVKFHNFNT